MVDSLVAKHLQHAEKPLIVVLGPTASGKTAFSIALAKWIRDSFSLREKVRMRGKRNFLSTPLPIPLPKGEGIFAEIINADSRQVYKYLNIGTAKIAKEEMCGIPHHLLDVLDPKEELTIAMYQQMATRTIDDILARGNVPILVGGSMLYISSIIDGLEPVSPVDPAVRKAFEMMYDEDPRAAYKKLEDLDSESAAAIDPKNRRYVVRALERTGAKKTRHSCSYDLLILGMDVPRATLHDAINARTEKLLAQGWIEEVKDLVERGYGPDDPGMKSHGYREIMECCRDAACRVSTDILSKKISTNVRHYAKRQMTWWRHDGRIHWIDPSSL